MWGSEWGATAWSEQEREEEWEMVEYGDGENARDWNECQEIESVEW